MKKGIAGGSGGGLERGVIFRVGFAYDRESKTALEKAAKEAASTQSTIDRAAKRRAPSNAGRTAIEEERRRRDETRAQAAMLREKRRMEAEEERDRKAAIRARNAANRELGRIELARTTAFQRAQNQYATAVNRQQILTFRFVSTTRHAAEGAVSLVRAYALLGAASEKDLGKALDWLFKFEAGIYAVGGTVRIIAMVAKGFDTLAKMIKAAEVAQKAYNTAAAIGAGINMATAGGTVTGGLSAIGKAKGVAPADVLGKFGALRTMKMSNEAVFDLMRNRIGGAIPTAAATAGGVAAPGLLAKGGAAIAGLGTAGGLVAIVGAVFGIIMGGVMIYNLWKLIKERTAAEESKEKTRRLRESTAGEILERGGIKGFLAGLGESGVEGERASFQAVTADFKAMFQSIEMRRSKTGIEAVKDARARALRIAESSAEAKIEEERSRLEGLADARREASRTKISGLGRVESTALGAISNVALGSKSESSRMIGAFRAFQKGVDLSQQQLAAFQPLMGLLPQSQQQELLLKQASKIDPAFAREMKTLAERAEAARKREEDVLLKIKAEPIKADFILNVKDEFGKELAELRQQIGFIIQVIQPKQPPKQIGPPQPDPRLDVFRKGIVR